MVLAQSASTATLNIESGDLTLGGDATEDIRMNAGGTGTCAAYLNLSGGTLTLSDSGSSGNFVIIMTDETDTTEVTISGGTLNVGGGFNTGSYGTEVTVISNTASINITGGSTFGPSSTLTFEFDSTGVSTWDTGGALTIDATANLVVDVSEWASKGTAGAKHDLVTFTTGPATEFNATVTGCADGYTGVIVYDSDSMYVTIVEDNAILYDFFESGSVTIESDSYVNFGSVGAGRVQASHDVWGISPAGALTNTTIGYNAGNGDKGVAWAIDLDGISGEVLTLRFDYSTAVAGEKVYAHIYGYKNTGVTPGADSNMLYLASNIGNLWTYPDTDDPAVDPWEMWDFVNGYVISWGTHNGAAGDAKKYNGSLTTVNVDDEFHLSNVQGGGPTDLSGFDYLVLAFARAAGTSGSPAITIDNLRLLARPAQGTVIAVR